MTTTTVVPGELPWGFIDWLDNWLRGRRREAPFGDDNRLPHIDILRFKYRAAQDTGDKNRREDN